MVIGRFGWITYSEMFVFRSMNVGLKGIEVYDLIEETDKDIIFYFEKEKLWRNTKDFVY